MRLTTLLRPEVGPDRGVSPVIGVILMVAITVILAAVIGTFVLGLGSQVGETAPQAAFSFELSNDGQNVTVIHDGGNPVPARDIKLIATRNFRNDRVAGTNEASFATIGGIDGTSEITAGTQVEVATVGSESWSGETIRVVWRSPSSDETVTVAKFTP